MLKILSLEFFQLRFGNFFCEVLIRVCNKEIDLLCDTVYACQKNSQPSIRDGAEEALDCVPSHRISRRIL